MKAITCSNRPLEDDSDLSIRRQPWMFRESCQRFGWEFENLALGIKHEWTGAPWLSLFIYWLRHQDPAEVVLYLDCWDSFLCATPAEVENRFRIQPHPILFAGEVNYYPDYCKEWAAYPVGVSRWRYANGGGWMGYAGDLLAMYTDHRFWPAAANCNQAAFHHWIINQYSPCMVDSACSLFQCLYHSAADNPPPPVMDALVVHNGCVFNTETESWPCAVHGNGGRAMEAVQLWRQICQK